MLIRGLRCVTIHVVQLVPCECEHNNNYSLTMKLKL